LIEEFFDFISPWTPLFGIILAIIFWFHALDYIRKEMPQSSENNCRIAALFASLGIVLAVLAHEFGHAFVAGLCGIKVVSIGLWPLGGYTQFAMPLTEMDSISEITISLAGPLVNLLIGLISLIPVKLLGESITENTIQYIAYMNIKLGVWNILPIIFLDGGWVVHGICRFIFRDAIIGTIITIVITGITLYWWLDYKEKFNEKLEEIRTL
jgi:Zn-dependent protease